MTTSTELSSHEIDNATPVTDSVGMPQPQVETEMEDASRT